MFLTYLCCVRPIETFAASHVFAGDEVLEYRLANYHDMLFVVNCSLLGPERMLNTMSR